MHCPACHVPNADDHRFCENCGTGLPRLCPGCGHECGSSARFCGNCGTALANKAAQVVVPQTAGWAELKSATILFADIVSSTEQIDGLDPEQTMGRLRPAIAQMCRTIESFGGTVVRTLGDGIMAIFGAPRALEGHARLACQAALALQGVFQRESESQGFAIRVGLHSGQVAADPLIADGVIGPDVYGHAIHLASRVVGLAEPGGVCITSATLALIRQECEVRGMGFHRLKGIAEPVEIHVVLRIRTELETLQFHQAALSAFRGRVDELASLQAAVRHAEGGNGAVIGVSGVPGAGKSRLCNELARWCREQQITVYKVRTEPYGHAAPLQSVLALMRTCFFQITAADDPAAARDRIWRRLSELGPAIAEDQALLNEFFSVTEPGAVACTLNPKARRARLLQLVRALAQQAGRSVSVIVFEDLHWLDEASAEFLAALVEATTSAHLLLLLNYRPSYKAPWLALSHFRQLDLTELEPEDIGQLVAELLANRSDLQAAIPLIVERAAGNPFFAEELAHSLVDSTPNLPPSDGPERLAAIAQALPATVQAVIGERIDRLAASQKAVLHICAVIGKEVSQALLQQVAVSLANQLERELDGLCEAELLLLLREITSGRRFAFRHPLIQEVAYSAQLKTRRAELHAAVALAMEAYYQAKPDEHAALIAFHFEAAGKLIDAARYESRAAQWLGATNSAQAMKHWRKARALMLNQPRSPEVDRLRVNIGTGFVYLGWREGMSPREVQVVVQETIELATNLDGRLIQLLLLAEGRILQGNGGPADDYVESLQKALALVGQSNDVGRTATMNSALSHAYAWAGFLRHGLDANDVALSGVGSIEKLDRDFFGFDIKQWVLGVRVRLLIRMQRQGEAQECLSELLAIIQPTHDPVIRQMAHYLQVELGLSIGNVALAKEGALNASKIGRINQSPYTKALDLWTGGMAEMASAEYENASVKFMTALTMVRTNRVALEFEAEILACLAECYYRLRDHQQSLSGAKEAVSVSRLHSNRVTECRALIVWAGSLIHIGAGANLIEAQEVLDQARQLVVLTGANICEPSLLLEQENINAMQKIVQS